MKRDDERSKVKELKRVAEERIRELKREAKEKQKRKKRTRRFGLLRENYEYGAKNSDVRWPERDLSISRVGSDGEMGWVTYNWIRDLKPLSLGAAKKVLTRDKNEQLSDEYLGQLFAAAKIYQKYRKGNRPFVRQRLLEVAEKLSEQEPESSRTSHYLKWLEKYLKRNPIHKTSFLSGLAQRIKEYFRKEEEPVPSYDFDYDPRSPEMKEYSASLQKKASQPQHSRKHDGKLETEVTRATSVILIISGIFFISANITGNAIGSLNISSSNYVGIALFILGIALGIFSLRKKNKKSKK